MSSLHLVTGYAGKEHVTSADQGSFHAALFQKGNVVLNVGNKFAATVVSNNSIKIQDGDILMQGRYIKLDSGTFIEVPIENGAQDYKRNDLIVVRYTKNSSTGVENTALVVIKGTPDITEAVDPEYTQADIYDGALVCDMPLYRVPIDGLNVGELVPLFEVVDSFDERIKAVLKSINDVVVAALKKITDGTTKVGNSDKLDGHDSEYFATAAGLLTELAKYLPLDGGGTVQKASALPMAIKNTVSDACYFQFAGKSGNLGSFGFNGADVPVWVDKTSGVTKGLIHTGNFDYHFGLKKPSGTYTGDGTATARTIATGGIGNMLLIYADGSNGFALVTPEGAIVSTGSSWSCNKPDKVCYKNGNLMIAISSQYFNTSGTTYHYQCI